MGTTQRHYLTLTFDFDLDAWATDYGIPVAEAADHAAESLSGAAPHIPGMIVEGWRALDGLCEVRAGTPTPLNPVAMLAGHRELAAALAAEVDTDRLQALRSLLAAEVARRADAAVLRALQGFYAGKDAPPVVSIGTSEYEDGHFFSEYVTNEHRAGNVSVLRGDVPGLDTALRMYGSVQPKAGLIVHMERGTVEYVDNLNER